VEVKVSFQDDQRAPTLEYLIWAQSVEKIFQVPLYRPICNKD
jgi:hypothetical protein